MVFLCNPPTAVVITEPFPLEGDIVQFTIEQPGVEEREEQQEDSIGMSQGVGEYTQYQTVQIKSLSYNSILGQ